MPTKTKKCDPKCPFCHGTGAVQLQITKVPCVRVPQVRDATEAEQEVWSYDRFARGGFVNFDIETNPLYGSTMGSMHSRPNKMTMDRSEVHGNITSRFDARQWMMEAMGSFPGNNFHCRGRWGGKTEFEAHNAQLEHQMSRFGMMVSGPNKGKCGIFFKGRGNVPVQRATITEKQLKELEYRIIYGCGLQKIMEFLKECDPGARVSAHQLEEPVPNAQRTYGVPCRWTPCELGVKLDFSRLEMRLVAAAEESRSFIERTAAEVDGILKSGKVTNCEVSFMNHMRGDHGPNTQTVTITLQRQL